MSRSTVHVCPKCEGMKHLEDGSTCPTCEGSGVVFEVKKTSEVGEEFTKSFLDSSLKEELKNRRRLQTLQGFE